MNLSQRDYGVGEICLEAEGLKKAFGQHKSWELNIVWTLPWTYTRRLSL